MCAWVCLRVSARGCVCVCVLFYSFYLTACFGSIQSSSSLHDFCPLRDGGMCDLALNDDGNMVRRQEKKTGEENHIAAITLFFYVLWSISRALVIYWTLQFRICV